MSRIAPIPVLLLLLLTLARAAPADEPFGDPLAALPLEERVNAAIEHGVTWLRAAQQDDGSWGPCVSAGITYDGQSVPDPRCYFVGPTAFSIFTLAKCGVPASDRGIKKGLKWIDKRAGSSYVWTSYESSAVILMLTALNETEEPLETSARATSPPRGSAFKRKDWRWMHERIEHLVGGKGKDGCQTSAGGWTYQPGQNRPDVSATQFALLALREASRAGYPVPASTWTRAADYLQGMQFEEGGFPYEAKQAGWSLGMTAAGLSSLLILDEQLELAEKPEPAWLKDAVERAFDELGRRYTPMANVHQDTSAQPIYHYCYLYAVERVGSLGRRRLLGKQLWYPYGAEYLLSAQQTDGRWEDPTCMKPHDVLGTCFALLFLKRTTFPSAVVTGN